MPTPLVACDLQLRLGKMIGLCRSLVTLILRRARRFCDRRVPFTRVSAASIPQIRPYPTKDEAQCGAG